MGMQVVAVGAQRFYAVGNGTVTPSQWQAFDGELAATAGHLRLKGIVDGWIVYEAWDGNGNGWGYRSLAPDGTVFVGGSPPYTS